MGDRANVYVKDRDQGVFLYAHWGGCGLPKDLQKALAREVRWKDPAYLARIIFDQMTAGDQGSETGFGISARISDNDSYPILVVDCDSEHVSLGSVAVPPVPTGLSWSFKEFCALTLADEEWPS